MLFSFGGSFSFFVYIYLFLCIFDKIVIYNDTHVR